jgi:RNA polymerase sigma-70 factor, ECF subfamily
MAVSTTYAAGHASPAAFYLRGARALTHALGRAPELHSPAHMEAALADEELMLRYRDGDAGAFDLLYLRHKGGLYRYIARLVGERGVAEEVFQDVWMNLVRARATYTVQAKFSTYLYRMAHNRVIDYFRRGKEVQLASFGANAADAADAEEDPLHAVPADPSNNPERQVSARQQSARLLELIAALPAAQREALLLREEAGMSVEEIAHATGVDRETAKSRLRYAVAKLERGMQGWL